MAVPRALIVTGTIALAGGVVALAHLVSRPRASGKGGSAGPDTLSGRLRAAALETLPDQGAILTLGSPLWDVILGGRKPDYLGGPAWGYYSTFAGEKDGQKIKGGTTCGTVGAYWASKAGFPADMIDRLPSDPAPGSGFRAGESISRFYAGAQRHGYLITPGKPEPGLPVAGAAHAGDAASSPIVAGDYYCIIHDGATYNGQPSSGEHVEVCLDVSAANAAGDRTVRSAAGGQKCGGNECARWVTRTLTAGGRLVRDGEARRLAWIVRAA